MKRKQICLTIIMILFFNMSFSQEQNEKYINRVGSLDKTLEALYDVISGSKGEERNWELFNYLFKPDARLIPASQQKNGEFDVQYQSTSDYINKSGKWLVSNGFFENEIHRITNTFGNISHVFSTYEAYQNESDKKPFMRGINSIQLLYDNNRWWIVNIYWTQETENNPIPSNYLPK